MKEQVVTVKPFKSKVWRGKYSPGVLWVREGLSPEEHAQTLKHELRHHRFYVKFWPLTFAYGKKGYLLLATLNLAAWLLNPWFFLAASSLTHFYSAGEIWASLGTHDIDRILETIIASTVWIGFFFVRFLV